MAGKSNGRLIAIIAAIAVIAAIVAALWWRSEKHEPELTDMTRSSGLPLTPEQQSVRFTNADLTFVVYPDKKAIDGHSILTLAVQRPIKRIQFDLDRNLPISRVTVNGQELAKDRWSNPQGRATIELPRTFQAGEQLKIALDYSGKPHVAKNAPWDGGFVWSSTKQGKPWIATAVEGEGCDLFWPCFDNSLVEVETVDLHIDVPQGLVAPSNGRFMGTTTGKDGRVVWNWRAHNPNNYAIALNIAPYKEIKADYHSRYGNVIPMHYWYLPGEDEQAKALFAEFAPTVAFFERTVGPYPFGDEKIAAVETPHLGMEHQTINAYGNEYKPAAEGFDWLFHHEFSHEWFGNQLTNRDWDDMWLHEGFGTYMQPLYARYLKGRMPYDAWMWRLRGTLKNKFPVAAGKHQLEHVVYDDKTGPGNDIYYKGAWVLHTLRGLIGDEPFFTSVRRLVYGRPDPKPGNFRPRFGTTAEFADIVSEEAGRDMHWFFDVYIRRAQLPRLVTRQVGNQLQLQWTDTGGKPFPMPVEIEVDGNTQTVAMADGRGSVTLPAANSAWTIDPETKVLRQDDQIDRFRDWTAAQQKKASKED
ncbi:MAG TPA: M1 family metallopeptidase [Sphingomicrobium sp.]|nr:M1 family metallopeptidase [Sphingomicrobium sp.]